MHFVGLFFLQLEGLILCMRCGQREIKMGDTKPVKGGCVVFLVPCIGGATSRCRICVRYIEHLTDTQQCLVTLRQTTML